MYLANLGNLSEYSYITSVTESLVLVTELVELTKSPEAKYATGLVEVIIM